VNGDFKCREYAAKRLEFQQYPGMHVTTYFKMPRNIGADSLNVKRKRYC